MLMTRPRRNLPLESQFSLEHTVQELGVLAAVAVVCTLIGAHDGNSACVKRVHERESVELVEGSFCVLARISRRANAEIHDVLTIVNIGRQSLPLGTWVASIFFLIEEPVLGLSLDAL